MFPFGRKVKLEVTDEVKARKVFRKKTRSSFNPNSPTDRQNSIRVWNKYPDLRKRYKNHPEHPFYIYYIDSQGRPTRMRM